MPVNNMKLPIGIEDFREIRTAGFYYVDKTGLIKDLSEVEKSAFKRFLQRNMDESVLYSSLKVLSELLMKHYGSKVIILIDEYDVPLAKAYENDYYDEMVFIIRNLFEQALKTNDSLQFAAFYPSVGQWCGEK